MIDRQSAWTVSFVTIVIAIRVSIATFRHWNAGTIVAAPFVRQTLAVVDALERILADRLAQLALGLAPSAASALILSVSDLGAKWHLLLHQQQTNLVAGAVGAGHLRLVQLGRQGGHERLLFAGQSCGRDRLLSLVCGAGRASWRRADGDH